MAIDLKKVVELYCDGGVIWDGSPGASKFGGTWAWLGIDADGNVVIEQSGVVESTATRHVTNNHTEQIAIVKALEAMPDGWSGKLKSDSWVAVCRVFENGRRKNLPQNISDRSEAAVARLGKIEWTLLAGHPTKAELETGISVRKPGMPVSIYDVRVDELCTMESKNYKKKLEEQNEQNQTDIKK